MYAFLCNALTVLAKNSVNKLEKLDVQTGKRYKILLVHVQRICEAHDKDPAKMAGK